MGDLTSFFAALLGAVANPFGILGAIREALVAAWRTGDRAQITFRETVKRFLAAPVAKLLGACAAFLVVILCFASSFAGDALQALDAEKRALAEQAEHLTMSIGFMSVAAIAVMAAAVYVIGRKRPLRAPLIMSGCVVIVGMGITTFMLYFLASRAENGWLWFFAAFCGAVTLIVAGVVIAVFRWILRKASAVLETGLGLAAPAVAILPGATMENVEARLRELIDIIPNEVWDEEVGKYFSTAFIAYAWFTVLGCFFISVAWSQTVAVVFLFALALGIVLRRLGIGEVVDESRKRIGKLLYHYAWIAFLVLGPAYRFYVAQSVQNGVGHQKRHGVLWITRFLEGSVGIGAWSSRWAAPLITLFMLIAALGAWFAAEKMKDGKVKWIIPAIPLLGVLYGGLSILISTARVMGDYRWGWNPFASEIQSRAEKERIEVTSLDGSSNAPSVVKQTETQVVIRWLTSRTARCAVVITGVEYMGKPYDKELVKDGIAVDVQGGAMHEVRFNNLAPGMTVRFFIVAEGTEGDSEGITSETDVFNVSATPGTLIAGTSSTADAAPVPPPSPECVSTAPPRPTSVPPSKLASANRAEADENLSSEEIERRFDKTLKELGIDP